MNVPAAMAQSASVSEPTVPAGIGSETTTPAGSADGPLFVTVIVYMVEVPAITDATPSVLVIERSADFVTVSVSVAALFAGVGSVAGDDVIVAVLTSVAGA